MGRELEILEKMSQDVEQSFISLVLTWGENKQTKVKEFIKPLCEFMDLYDKEVIQIRTSVEKAKKQEQDKLTAASSKLAKIKEREKDTEVDSRKANIEERKKALEEKKKKLREEKVADEIFTGAAAAVQESALTGAVFTKRRLRRQVTLKAKQS